MFTDAYVPSLKREDVKLSLDESGTHLDPVSISKKK